MKSKKYKYRKKHDKEEKGKDSIDCISMLHVLQHLDCSAAQANVNTSVSVVNNEHWPGLPFFLALALLSWTVRVLLKFIGKQHAVVSRVFDKGLQPLVISAQTHITKTSAFNKIINYTQESLSLVWQNGGDVKRTLTLKHEGGNVDFWLFLT